MRRPCFRAWTGPLVGAALLAWVLPGSAAVSAPKQRHAAILARALSYELSLDERAGASVGVAIVYKPGHAASEKNANDWYAALSELTSLKIKDKPFFVVRTTHAQDDMAAAIERLGADVLLVTDGLEAEADAIGRFAASKRVLSASNAPSAVERHLTLCVADDGDKLKVVINLTSAQRERIRFSSNLLKLAKLIR